MFDILLYPFEPFPKASQADLCCSGACFLSQDSEVLCFFSRWRTDEMIFRAVSRNFGGLPPAEPSGQRFYGRALEPCAFLKSHGHELMRNRTMSINVKDMLVENLSDKDARHLMLISREVDVALHLIRWAAMGAQRILGELNKPRSFVNGASQLLEIREELFQSSMMFAESHASKLGCPHLCVCGCLLRLCASHGLRVRRDELSWCATHAKGPPQSGVTRTAESWRNFMHKVSHLPFSST